MCPYSPEDNFKQLLANYKHACTANYSIMYKKSTPAEGGKPWSTFRAGVIMTFSKREEINKLTWDITSKSHA